MPFKADKSNVPTAMLRWSLFKGAREFAVNEHTLGKKLGEANELPGPDECFSTRQILRGLYGEVYAERLRKTKEEADSVALKNAIMRSDFLPRRELERLLAEIAGAMVQTIKASPLPRESQDDLRRALSAIPVTIRSVADHQRIGRNGDSSPRRKTKSKKKAVSGGTAPEPE